MHSLSKVYNARVTGWPHISLSCLFACLILAQNGHYI